MQGNAGRGQRKKGVVKDKQLQDGRTNERRGERCREGNLVVHTVSHIPFHYQPLGVRFEEEEEEDEECERKSETR